MFELPYGFVVFCIVSSEAAWRVASRAWTHNIKAIWDRNQFKHILRMQFLQLPNSVCTHVCQQRNAMECYLLSALYMKWKLDIVIKVWRVIVWTMSYQYQHVRIVFLYIVTWQYIHCSENWWASSRYFLCLLRVVAEIERVYTSGDAPIKRINCVVKYQSRHVKPIQLILNCYNQYNTRHIVHSSHIPQLTCFSYQHCALLYPFIIINYFLDMLDWSPH